jgi:hypothetical protein
MLAALVGSLIVGMVVVTVSYLLFFAQTNASDYLGCRTAEHAGMGFFIYNVKFSAYVAALAAMTMSLCACAACFAGLLGRHSASIVNMMLKAVPAGAALSVLALLAMFYSFTSSNFLINGPYGVYSGNIPYFEVFACGAFAVIGLAAAAVAVMRERRVDVA